MKRFKTLLGFIFLLFGAIILASCGNKNKEDVKLPENNYEKVTFAFNGVEKSLKNKSTKLKSQNNLNALTNISQDTLDVIFSKMEETSGSNPKIEYNETPLIQFQYLKAAYEKFGEKLTFNTKYSYDFEGDIYDREIIVEFIDFIRPEKRFDDIVTLKKQIETDVKKAQKILLAQGH